MCLHTSAWSDVVFGCRGAHHSAWAPRPLCTRGPTGVAQSVALGVRKLCVFRSTEPNMQLARCTTPAAPNCCGGRCQCCVVVCGLTSQKQHTARCIATGMHSTKPLLQLCMCPLAVNLQQPLSVRIRRGVLPVRGVYRQLQKSCRCRLVLSPCCGDCIAFGTCSPHPRPPIPSWPQVDMCVRCADGHACKVCCPG